MRQSVNASVTVHDVKRISHSSLTITDARYHESRTATEPSAYYKNACGYFITSIMATDKIKIDLTEINFFIQKYDKQVDAMMCNVAGIDASTVVHSGSKSK